MRMILIFVWAALLCACLPLLALMVAGLAGLAGITGFVRLGELQGAALNTTDLALSQVLGSAVWGTVTLSSAVVLIALVLGTALAWLTSQYQFVGRRWFEVLLITPIALPAYVAAYAWVELSAYEAPLANALRAAGVIERLPDIRNTAGAAWVLGVSLMPYIYTLARLAFTQQALRLGEVAASLGLNHHQALRRIYLPLAWPALAAGSSLVLMESMADYGVAAYMGVDTLTVAVYKTWFAGEQKPMAIVMVLCLIAACATLLWLESRWRGVAAKFQLKNLDKPCAQTRLPLQPAAAWTATALCTAVVVLGFAAPLGTLLWLWLRDWLSTGMAFNTARLVPAISHSVQFASAGASCVLCLVTAALLLQRLAWRPWRSFEALMHANQLGYAIPGVAIALAILWPVATIDKTLAHTFGTEMLLTGGAAGVVLAYVIRFYAVGHHSVQQGLTRISPNLQDAATSLGASSGQIIKRLYIPLLTPSLASAWILVWIDCLKELPATLMLRPFNSDTLPVLVYQFISDERPAQAALPSLLLILVGLVPVAFIAKRQ
jgi:iron(III) transport system permease protein